MGVLAPTGLFAFPHTSALFLPLRARPFWHMVSKTHEEHLHFVRSSAPLAVPVIVLAFIVDTTAPSPLCHVTRSFRLSYFPLHQTLHYFLFIIPFLLHSSRRTGIWRARLWLARLPPPPPPASLRLAAAATALRPLPAGSRTSLPGRASASCTPS